MADAAYQPGASHTMQRDPYNLDRFLEAQASNYEDALAELNAGSKQSHWSWYVFPQIRGLGSSPTSVRYAIGSRAEASAYIAHPVLGLRLRECVNAMLGQRGLTAAQILGDIDAQKFRSCLTLFLQVAPNEGVFSDALKKYFDGVPDQKTLSILGRETGGK
jgi:uncharacterized protein (DUF1810 family)